MLLTYVARRIGMGAALLLVVSFLLFSLQYFAPGSQLSTLLGGQPATPERIASLTAEYHLDDPLLVQYWSWLRGALSLDFGTSVVSGTPVIDRIAEFLPLTALLAGLTLLTVTLVGVPLGVAAGIHNGRLLDRTVSTATVVGMSAPPFAVGILLIYVLGVSLGVLPTYGGGTGQFGDRLVHLVLPVVTLSLSLTAVVARQTRASTLSVMSSDFVTFARARGVSTRRILTRYALRNCALPVITTVGLLMIQLAGGTILVETVFSLPGVGSLMVKSVQGSDVPVVQALGLIIALVVVISMLLVDLVSAVVDPRTRLAVGS